MVLVGGKPIAFVDESGNTVDEIEVHQLLCGREIANDYRNSMVHQIAAQMANFVYLVIDRNTKTATAIDPTWDVKGIMKFTNDMNVKITESVATHHHPDHVGGKFPRGFLPPQLKNVAVEGLFDMYAQGDCRVAIGDEDAAIASHLTSVEEKNITHLKDGDIIPIGKNTKIYLRVIQTPGHTAGSCCFRLESSTLKSTGPAIMFTGDTLFIGSCGRTDLPDSDAYDMLASLKKLSDFPKDDLVLPGHNYAMTTQSTIDIERKTNIMMINAMERAGSIAANKTSASTTFVQLDDYIDIAEHLLKSTHTCISRCDKVGETMDASACTLYNSKV